MNWRTGKSLFRYEERWFNGVSQNMKNCSQVVDKDCQAVEGAVVEIWYFSKTAGTHRKLKRRQCLIYSLGNYTFPCLNYPCVSDEKQAPSFPCCDHGERQWEMEQCQRRSDSKKWVGPELWYRGRQRTNNLGRWVIRVKIIAVAVNEKKTQNDWWWLSLWNKLSAGMPLRQRFLALIPPDQFYTIISRLVNRAQKGQTTTYNLQKRN